MLLHKNYEIKAKSMLKHLRQVLPPNLLALLVEAIEEEVPGDREILNKIMFELEDKEKDFI